MIFNTFKIIIQILVFSLFFSSANTKNLDKFNNGEQVSDYISGILLLNDNEYEKSYKFLRKLDGLEQSHINFSTQYLFSLINFGKFSEAYNYSLKLEKKGINTFESDLILGIYHLKNKNFDLAQKYFFKAENNEISFFLNKFIANSLGNWSSFKNLNYKDAVVKIESIDPRYKNLKKIQNVFLHCYYDSQKTEYYFEELSSNEDIDFSRYSYFYSLYLFESGKISESKKILESSIQLYPRNLLLNQFKINLDKRVAQNYNNFDCKNISHVVAEILYIASNALSVQSFYKLSNFYINLSKYLNENFKSYDTLLAENYYKINNFLESEKIYKKVEKLGQVYFWYSVKQNAKIMIKLDKQENAIKYVTNNYAKLSNKNIYEKFDYAEFLKNNEKFEQAVRIYSEILELIENKHPLYADIRDGRGVAYERLGDWEKAEKDLLASLEAKPDQAYVINYLAYSWVEQGKKIEKSLSMLEKANALKVNDPFIIDSLGWALYKLKKYSESKNYLQTAVQLLPADPTVNDHYGDVLWKTGNKIQARYYWNYVLGLKDTKDELKKKIKGKLISGL